MSWLFINRFISEGEQIGVTSFSVFGYLLAIIAILAGFCWWKDVWEYWLRRAKLFKFAMSLPGPPTLPLLGNALEFAVSAEDTLDKVVELVRNNESIFRFWLGPKLVIVISDPKDYEIILASSKASYKDPIYDLLAPAVGKGLVSGSGPTHRAHRKIIMPMVNGKALLTYLQSFNTHSRYCTKLLKSKVDCGEFDILPFMTNCTSDMMLESLIGTTGTAQKGGYKQFVYYSHRIYEFLHMRMVKVWLHPAFIFYQTKMGQEQKMGLNIIHGIIDNIIARKKKEYLAVERGVIDVNDLRVSLLDQLIEHTMKNNSMNDLELRYEIYTVYIAAQDTVAVIVSFAFLMLAMHPEIQEKVRQEIMEIVGDDDVEEKHLSNMNYLDMVIRETVRMYPIAPLMVRKTTGEIKLTTCTLPENCSIVLAAYMTHRSPKHWVDPEKFNPDRFRSDIVKERHPYSFIAFSGGLRGCVGQKFAVMCLKTIITNIIREYRFETNQTLNDLKLKMDISVRSRSGYKVTMHRVYQ